MRRSVVSSLVVFQAAAVLGVVSVEGVRADATPAGERWTRRSVLEFSAGGQDDLLLDPSLDRSVVPAGAFVDLRLSSAAIRDPRSGRRLRWGVDAAVERYLDRGGRTLLGGAAHGEVLQRMRRHWNARVRASSDFFDDSERDGARRIGAGMEVAVGGRRQSWNLEFLAGGEGRVYPDLEFLATDGTSTTYAEAGVHLGARATVGLGRLGILPEFRLRMTDARDPLFDSTTLDAGIRASLRFSERLEMNSALVRQSRSFRRRPNGDDRDSLARVALELRIELSDRTTAFVGASTTRYERTDTSQEDTRRFSVGVSRAFSPRGARYPSRPAYTPTAVTTPNSEDPPGLPSFRLPRATRAHIVGSFNGWDSTADPLERGADGRWRPKTALPAGIHHFRLLVDGRWVLPSEEFPRVDDGFDGQNAVLWIPSPLR